MGVVLTPLPQIVRGNGAGYMQDGYIVVPYGQAQTGSDLVSQVCPAVNDESGLWEALHTNIEGNVRVNVSAVDAIVAVRPTDPNAVSNSFTATGTSGVYATGTGAGWFALLVIPTGAVTSWDVRIEGSLDQTFGWTQIIQHTNITPGSSLVAWTPNNVRYPSAFWRVRCAGLVLGAGTNIITTALGLAM